MFGTPSPDRSPPLPDSGSSPDAGRPPSAERLKVLTDALPALISYVDTSLVYRLVNRTYEDWFKRDVGTIVGRTVLEVVGEEAFALLRPWFDAALAGNAVHFDALVPYRDAGERFVEASYIPDRREDGTVQGLYVLVVDVGDRRRAEEARERALEEERRARAAAERSRAWMARLQAVTAALASTTTVEAVARVVADAGREATSALTCGLGVISSDASTVELSALAGVDADAFTEWLRVPLTRRAPITECIVERRDVYVETREQLLANWPNVADLVERAGIHSLADLPVYASDGRVLGAVSYAWGEPMEFDVETRELLSALRSQCGQALERAQLHEAERLARGQTQRLLESEREARAEAEEARASAERANLAKSQFLAVMSHEIRTPLNAIAGHAQLLEMGIHGEVNAAQLDALQRIERSQRHLLRLINDVLDYARIEAGGLNYHMTDVHVCDVLTDIAPMVEPLFAAKGITMESRLSHAATAGSAELVVADREKLAQIMLNVLSNAAKFTPPGGRVTIELGERADGSQPETIAFVRITDTGPGIPPQSLESVFEPFVQADNRYTRASEGVGLGLAISRDLARGMGGELRVRSREGAGARFTLTLPRARARRTG